MRHILLDRGRRRVTAKRGGAAPRVNLDDVPDLGSSRARELIALDDALKTLAEVDARKARVVELRFFGGLSVEETAEVLKVFSRYHTARLEAGARLAAGRTGRKNVDFPPSNSSTHRSQPGSIHEKIFPRFQFFLPLCASGVKAGEEAAECGTQKGVRAARSPPQATT
jgi:hypothetical protein